jgi:hypothetical protein
LIIINKYTVIKSRDDRWAGQVALLADKMNAYRSSVEKAEGERILGRLDLSERIILKLFSEKYGWVVWNGSM